MFVRQKKPKTSYLDGAAGNENVLLVYVQVDVGNGGEVGRAPFVKVGDELEGEVGQLVAVGGQNEGAGGRKTKRRPVKGPENPAARGDAVLRAPNEAASDAVAQGALFFRLTAPRVALNQVPTDALAALGTVAVPEKLFGLKTKKHFC